VIDTKGPSEAGTALSLSSALRNLGSRIGTATLSTVLTKREPFPSTTSGPSITTTDG